MGMHAVLYRSSQAIGATNASLTAVPFSQDVVYNNKILPQNPMDLFFATLYGTGLSVPRIQTPLLIQTASNQCSPYIIGTSVPTNPNTADFSNAPVQFRENEGIDVQTTNTDAGAQTHTAILQLGNKQYGMPSGQRLKILATASFICTSGAWNYIPLTYQDNLPNKWFAIVGMEVIAANGVLGRLDIPSQAWKPGVPVNVAAGNRMFWKQYDQPFGELGRFRNTSLPNLELYVQGACTAQAVYLDIVVIG